MAGDRRNAFSLIEMLALTVVAAILVVAIFSRVISPSVAEKDGELRFNLHAVRAQIEMYKSDHAGKPPRLAGFADQMTKPTDVAGGTTGKTALGPYFKAEIPPNPFNASNAVAAVAIPGKPPTATVPGGAGWQYDETTGGFYPNNSESYP